MRIANSFPGLSMRLAFIGGFVPPISNKSRQYPPWHADNGATRGSRGEQRRVFRDPYVCVDTNPRQGHSVCGARARHVYTARLHVLPRGASSAGCATMRDGFISGALPTLPERVSRRRLLSAATTSCFQTNQASSKGDAGVISRVAVDSRPFRLCCPKHAPFR